MTDHPDFSVVVKNRGRLPSPWKWEIYRAGRNSPVKQSEVYFSTVTEANRAGRKALSLFLSEYHDEVPAVQFVLVNNRVPRTGQHCALCGGLIERGYVRDSQTRLIYCDTQCFPGWAQEAAPVIKTRGRKAS